MISAQSHQQYLTLRRNTFIPYEEEEYLKMKVTELAVFKLKGDGSLTDNSWAELREAKDAMQGHMSSTLYYIQQIEDPRFIYGLGEWPSISAHHDALRANQERLVGLANVLEVESLIHLDVGLLPRLARSKILCEKER